MIEEFLIRLHNGELDDRLSEIDDGIIRRRQILREVSLSDIANGTRVKLVRIKPKYMAGHRGEVVRKEGDRFVVRLDADSLSSLKARNRGANYISASGTVTVSRNCVEKA